MRGYQSRGREPAGQGSSKSVLKRKRKVLTMVSSKKALGCLVIGLWLVAGGCGGGDDAAKAPEGDDPAETADYFKVDPATAATLTGKTSIEGETPKIYVQNLNMSAEPDCKKLHDTAPAADAVVRNGDMLQNVFVWVKGGLEGKKFEVSKDAVQLDQKGCIYSPHVLALQTRQMFKVSNSDPTTHNVHPLPKVNREWNRSQSEGASAIEYDRFTREEIMLPVKCNIHPWMRAYINVVDHPFFAVSGADGSFEIKGLPPGTYTIGAKHERLGDQEMSVTLGDAESKDIAFSFNAAG